MALPGRHSRPALPLSALYCSSLTGWRCGQRDSCAGIRHLGAGPVAAWPRKFRQGAQGLRGRETHRQRPAAARGAPARPQLGCPGSLFACRDGAEPGLYFRIRPRCSPWTSQSILTHTARPNLLSLEAEPSARVENVCLEAWMQHTQRRHLDTSLNVSVHTECRVDGLPQQKSLTPAGLGHPEGDRAQRSWWEEEPALVLSRIPQGTQPPPSPSSHKHAHFRSQTLTRPLPSRDPVWREGVRRGEKVDPLQDPVGSGPPVTRL